MGRPVHTHRTDPDFAPDRAKVSFRLAQFQRERVEAAAASGLIPEVHNASDAFQDATWLWLYAIEQEYGSGVFTRSNGHGATGGVRDRVGATASPRGEDVPGEEVGVVSATTEGGSGSDS